MVRFSYLLSYLPNIRGCGNLTKFGKIILPYLTKILPHLIKCLQNRTVSPRTSFNLPVTPHLLRMSRKSALGLPFMFWLCVVALSSIPCKRPIQSAHFFFSWAFGPLPNQFLANGIECRWGLNPGLPAARLPPGPGFLLAFLECQDLQALCHRLCGHPDVEAGE